MHAKSTSATAIYVEVLLRAVHTVGEFALFENFAKSLTELEVTLRLCTLDELLELI